MEGLEQGIEQIKIRINEGGKIMRSFITTIKEDEVSPYIICMAQIIRPLDGTTFNVGNVIKVVYFDKDTPKYAVGQPDSSEYLRNEQCGIEYEDWTGMRVYTTQTQCDSNSCNYPPFKEMTSEQKRIQAKKRANSLYHGYAKKDNAAYALLHKKTLREFPYLKPDPGIDLMKPHMDGHCEALNIVDQICDTMGSTMANSLGINIDELRAFNQIKKEEHAEWIKKHYQPVYAGEPPLKTKQEKE
jgi:hypothetical protein